MNKQANETLEKAKEKIRKARQADCSSKRRNGQKKQLYTEKRVIMNTIY